MIKYEIHNYSVQINRLDILRETPGTVGDALSHLLSDAKIKIVAVSQYSDTYQPYYHSNPQSRYHATIYWTSESF